MFFLSYSLLAKKIVFTNDFERRTFLNFFPWATSRSVIIPIGNNIPVDAKPPSEASDNMRLTYFGQITENKGIDFFVETVRTLRNQNHPVEAVIIGSIINERSPIVDFVRNASAQHGIELLLNLPSTHVSYELQRPTIALLAFPDGITDKRGSALACLDHGNTVITLHTDKTPEWLKQVTYHAATSYEAANVVIDLFSSRKVPQPNASILEKEMAARAWEIIALEHVALYKE